MNTKKQIIGVIGVGRFGSAVVETLLENHVEIIAIDKNEEKLKPYSDKISGLWTLDKFDREHFLECGLDKCRIVVVCIGRDLESNLLATLCALEVGVPRVISKVMSEEHAKILKKIGAESINPETEMGARLAMSISRENTFDYLNMGGGFSIVEVQAPDSYENKTIVSLNLRQKHNINIVALSRSSQVNGNISPNLVVQKGDHLIVAGNTEDITAFQRTLDR